MIDFGESRMGLKFTNDSITWGEYYYDDVLCTDVPSNGSYRRQNEQAVLPHALGCQNPTAVQEYRFFLQGKIKI